MAWAVYKPASHRAVKVFTPNLTWVCLVIPVQCFIRDGAAMEYRLCTGILIHFSAINPKP